MTLIEVLVSSGILSISLLALLGAFQYLGGASRKAKLMTAEDRITASLVDNLRANIKHYAIDPIPFDPADRTDILDKLAENKLPMAWSENVIETAQNCPDCPGRYGFVIKPVSGYAGVYVVFLAMTHKELYQGQRRILQFMASSQ